MCAKIIFKDFFETAQRFFSESRSFDKLFRLNLQNSERVMVRFLRKRFRILAQGRWLFRQICEPKRGEDEKKRGHGI